MSPSGWEAAEADLGRLSPRDSLCRWDAGWDHLQVPGREVQASCSVALLEPTAAFALLTLRDHSKTARSRQIPTGCWLFSVPLSPFRSVAKVVEVTVPMAVLSTRRSSRPAKWPCRSLPSNISAVTLAR